MIFSFLAFSRQPSESSLSFVPIDLCLTNEPQHIQVRSEEWYPELYFFFVLLKMKHAKQNLRVVGRSCLPERQIAIDQFLLLTELLPLTDVLFKILRLLGFGITQILIVPLEKICSWSMVGSSVAVTDSCSGLSLLWVKKIKLPIYLSAIQAYQFTK